MSATLTHRRPTCRSGGEAALYLAGMPDPHPSARHDVSTKTAVATTAGAGLLGATIGWVLMRGAYRLDHGASSGAATPPMLSGDWTDASFSLWVVAATMATLAATFIAIAVAVILAYRQRDAEHHRRTTAPAPPATATALDLLHRRFPNQSTT